jgi:hypothetical protein
MPINANYQVKCQTSGAEHANRQAGGALQIGEAVTMTVSPAQGVTTSGLATDYRAGAMNPASVFGTGDNPDLLLQGAEAV